LSELERKEVSIISASSSAVDSKDKHTRPLTIPASARGKLKQGTEIIAGCAAGHITLCQKASFLELELGMISILRRVV
jgi:hypothetical protein